MNLANLTSDSLMAGQTKYYSLPFAADGVTLRLDVTAGYVSCYASDTVRNPGPSDYVWFLETGGYNDSFIDPVTLNRSPGRYLYVALLGVNPANVYILDSALGDRSTLGKYNSLT